MHKEKSTERLGLLISDNLEICYVEPLGYEPLHISIRTLKNDSDDVTDSGLIIWITREWLSCIFNSEDINSSFKELLSGDANRLDFVASSSVKIKNIMEQIRRISYEGAAYKIYLRGKILEIFACLIVNLEENEEKSINNEYKNHQLFDRAKDVLMHSFENPPSINELAQQLNVSARILNSVFRHFCGMTVFEWLNQARLEEACNMLRGKYVSIKEVSAALGYSHPNNFINAFTRKYGVSPGRYRNEGEQ